MLPQLNNKAEESPLDIQNISEKQQQDEQLLTRAKKHKDLFFESNIDGHAVICYCKDKEQRSFEPNPSNKKVGRNDSCPCGSGKKYKHCHGSIALG